MMDQSNNLNRGSKDANVLHGVCVFFTPKFFALRKLKFL